MVNYSNELIEFNGCPGCAYARGEFSLPCGIAYQNEMVVLSQDWELPIPGFMIVSTVKHAEKFEELSKEEQIEVYSVVDKTIKILRDNKVCDRFNVLFEEKQDRHFHVWIMPRYEWMRELVGDIIDNVGKILDYSKENFKNEETFKEIKRVSNLVKEGFNNIIVD